MVARSSVDGTTATYPVAETVQVDSQCHTVIVPARVAAETAKQAAAVATAAVASLAGGGIFGVELFAMPDGSVLLNEIAPRPHNSGHLTIEGCETSQFEQHVRAVCNLPLGSTQQRTPIAAMANLLGDLWTPDGQAPEWIAALADPSVSLHLYGKEQAKPSRKMGHLTMTGHDRETVVRRLSDARSKLPQA